MGRRQREDASVGAVRGKKGHDDSCAGGMGWAHPVVQRLLDGVCQSAAAAATKRLYPPPVIVRQHDIALSRSMPGICGAKYCSGSAISQITFLAYLYTIDSRKSQAFWQLYLFYCELCAVICQTLPVVGCFLVVVHLYSERDIGKSHRGG